MANFEDLISDTMGRFQMRIYLAETQVLDVEGGQRLYKAPGYFNVDQELAEKWIGEGIAVEATKDNTHVEPEHGWAYLKRQRKAQPKPLLVKLPKPKPVPRKAQPKPLVGSKAPKGKAEPRKAKPKPLEGPKAPKGEQPKGE